MSNNVVIECRDGNTWIVGSRKFSNFAVFRSKTRNIFWGYKDGEGWHCFCINTFMRGNMNNMRKRTRQVCAFAASGIPAEGCSPALRLCQISQTQRVRSCRMHAHMFINGVQRIACNMQSVSPFSFNNTTRTIFALFVFQQTENLILFKLIST